ncbi:Emopamil binding protein-domain-containing protein [Xylariaceae sp. FL1019]|nr:Emopamil binding protein-domain-containing protein [Xylariaceae sp. FL1019]
MQQGGLQQVYLHHDQHVIRIPTSSDKLTSQSLGIPSSQPSSAQQDPHHPRRMGNWWWQPVEEVTVVSIPPSPTHPYHPLGIDIPAYATNEAPLSVLLAALCGTLGFTVLSAALVARKYNPGLRASGLAVFCWFVMNACLHCVFEGYFVLNHTTVASSQSLLAQLWKEYALSDSRYLTSDIFMLSVESITVFIWGPLCLANAIAIAKGSPSRHALRIIACMAHLYGVALYYATSQCESYFTGRSHSRPEVVYFWVYYVGFNLPWVIVPAILMFDSVATVTRAMRALDKAEATLHRHRASEGSIAEPKKTK